MVCNVTRRRMVGNIIHNDLSFYISLLVVAFACFSLHHQQPSNVIINGYSIISVHNPATDRTAKLKRSTIIKEFNILRLSRIYT